VLELEGLTYYFAVINIVGVQVPGEDASSGYCDPGATQQEMRRSGEQAHTGQQAGEEAEERASSTLGTGDRGSILDGGGGGHRDRILLDPTR